MSRKLLAAIVGVAVATLIAPMVVFAVAPSITVLVTPASPNGSNGWYTSNVTVDWTVDGPPAPTVTGCVDMTIAADQQATTYNCAACERGRPPIASTAVAIKRDATKPDIVGTRTPAGNAAGWNNTNVLVSFSCTDATSGVATNTVGGGTLLTTDLATHSVTNSGTCVDAAGNTADPETVSSIKIDKTLPTISAATTAAPNGTNNWYKGNVTVAFTCADSLSLIDTCPANQVLSTEGATVQSSALTATDNAGNVSNASNVLTVKIDKTPPTLAPSLPAAATEVLLNAVVSATPNATDAVSGVASSSCGAVATDVLGHVLDQLHGDGQRWQHRHDIAELHRRQPALGHRGRSCSGRSHPQPVGSVRSPSPAARSPSCSPPRGVPRQPRSSSSTSRMGRSRPGFRPRRSPR